MGFECYRIGDLLLDAGTQEVTRNGVAVRVPRLSFKLLLSLARHAPNVVTVQQLENEVWAGLIVDRGTVNKRVLLLRNALGKDKNDEPYIAVVRGSGYRLVAQVDRIDAPAAELSPEPVTPKNWYQRSSGVMRTTSYWLLGVVAVLALYQGYHNSSLVTVGPKTGKVATRQIQPSPAVYSQKSIAVLPFVDLSGGQSHQFLGDGIAEEIINLLTGMDDLSVAARTSSFSFRDTQLTTLDISQRLKVGSILEGSIRHTDKRIRVTAQLIDAETGYHIWSKNYDRAIGEIFEIQDDIALNISQALRLTLNEKTQPNSRKSISKDMMAFGLFLKGRELLNNRIQVRAEGLLEALDLFKRSAKQDPEFAKAHANMALTYWLLTSYDDTLDEEEYFNLAEASANFALELDPDSTDALAALALVCASRFDVEKAVTLFEKIRVIGSNDSNIKHWEAMLHIRLGYFDELIVPLTEIYRLDPFNEHIGWSLAAALNFSGEPDKAAAILAKLEHFTYRQYALGLTAINKGDFPNARDLLRGVRMRSGVLPEAYADLLIDALEDPSLAEENAQQFLAAVAKGELSKYVGFESLLILGSPHAFELGVEPKSGITKIQIHAQIWNNWGLAVRQDPRFKDWVEALGYAGFWRKYGWPDRCGPTGPDDFECI